MKLLRNGVGGGGILGGVFWVVYFGWVGVVGKGERLRIRVPLDNGRAGGTVVAVFGASARVGVSWHGNQV